MPMRVLAVTQLFPNGREPAFAAFNRQQFRALAETCDLRVLATIPWFPGCRFFARWSRAGRLAGLAARERIDSISVEHPRVPFIPRLPQTTPWLYAARIAPVLWRCRHTTDVVLASWAYPDAAAAILASRRVGLPVAVKVHGSDLNVLAERPVIRRALQRLLPLAGRVIAVSRPLAEKVRLLGVPADKVSVVDNGVDRNLFQLRDAASLRQTLGLDAQRRWAIYVGRLEEDKGVRDLLEAAGSVLAARQDLGLILVGSGRLRAESRAMAARYPGRVVCPGALPLSQVAQWLSASDFLVLPSWNEGTPNVILEAFASGKPVLATRVGAIPELVRGPHLGRLVAPRDRPGLAAALGEMAQASFEPAEIVAAAPHDWLESALQLRAALALAAGQPQVAAQPPDDLSTQAGSQHVGSMG